MGKDKGKTKPKKEAPSPLHSGSEAVMAVHERDNPAMTADSDSEISDRMARHDSGASLPNTPGTSEAKVHRDPVAGMFVPGPRVPGQPTSHDVLAVDANDSAQTDALRRSSAPSMPNGMPPGPADRPVVNVLDVDDVQRLAE